MCGARCWSFSSSGKLAGVWKQWWTKFPRLKWRLRVISPLMNCAKNEPTPRNVLLGGKMGICALAGPISATCLTCEVSEGWKSNVHPRASCQCRGSNVPFTVRLSSLPSHWNGARKARNLRSWVPLRVTRRGHWTSARSMNRHIVRLQARRPLQCLLLLSLPRSTLSLVR